MSDAPKFDNLQAIRDVADEMGVTRDPKYSGRAMYGTTCIALYLDNWEQPYEVMFKLGAINESEENPETTQELFNVRLDSWGHGCVMYWPDIPGLREGETEDPSCNEKDEDDEDPTADLI